MTFVAPVAEQMFVLRHIAGVDGVDPDMLAAITDGAGRFAESVFAPLNRVGDVDPPRIIDGQVHMPAGFARAWRDYVDNGWGGISAPAQWGGQGLPFALGAAVMESLGGANMAFGLCPMLTLGAIEALVHHGSAEQQAQYLPRLATGEWTGTMNLTEPQAGSDVGALRTVATPLADGSYGIRGSKIFITFGDHDLASNIVHLVLARTSDAPAGTKGVSMFLVPKFRLDSDGNIGEFNDVRAVKIEHKLGIHASPTCVMAFGDNDACVGYLVGDLCGGMRAMFTMMNNARLNVGLQGVQIGEAAMQHALAYARGREQSPRAGSGSSRSVAIIEHPDVRRMAMRGRALTQGARALVYYAFAQVDRAREGDAAAGLRADLLTPLAKGYGTDIGVEVSSIALQMHGGMGYVEESGAAQFYRDARIAPIYEGTNGIQAADLVGRKLGLDGGAAVAALLDDIAADSGDSPTLRALVDELRACVGHMDKAAIDDRLAGSAPLLTMMAVACSGWLMARQGRVAADMLDAGAGDRDFLSVKRAIARYYVDVIVPEAMGLAAGVRNGTDALYTLTTDQLAGTITAI